MLVSIITAYVAYQIIRGIFTQLLADIQKESESRKQINQLIFYDELTRLPNRRMLNEHLLLGLKNNPGVSSALLLFDIDGFKKINDAMGYEAGDAVLIGLADFFKSNTKQHDLVARVGDDEFAIVLNSLGDNTEATAHNAIKIAYRLRERLINTPVNIYEHNYLLDTSIGISLVCPGEDDVMRQADLALQEAKQNADMRVMFYEKTIQTKAEHRLTLERDLLDAINNGKLSLNIQSQLDVQGRIIGAELLCRWHHPDHGFISPGVFIPMAEETGLITILTQWVFKQACLLIDELLKHDIYITLSINISPKTIINSSFINFVKSSLINNKYYGKYLIFEITENIWLEDGEVVVKHLEDLNKFGIRFSVDDFGTGYSNLSAIKKLPFYELKIDKSLIDEINTNKDNCIIIKSILAMATQLSLKTVAEGVEDHNQAIFLYKNGCELIQGYLFAKPVTAIEWFKAILDNYAKTA